MIDNTSKKKKKILKGLVPKTTKPKKGKSKEPEDYSQYLVMEIMNRAMTNVLEKPGKK